MSLYAFPAPGHLPSEITTVAVPKLLELEKTLPPGYGMSIGGEFDKQKVGFRNLGVVLAVSISTIYLALLFQFNNAIKPLLVFAAAPYGVAGALIALVGDEHVVRIHGVSRNCELDWRHRQPRDRPVRLHRRDARQGRAVRDRR